MANTAISKINVEDNGTTAQYLIEPTLYTSAALESGKTSDYVATLDNFELFNGVAANVSFAANVVANATLNINSTGAKNIYYDNQQITANLLKASRIYTLIYNANLDNSNGGWVVSGNAGTLTHTLATTTKYYMSGTTLTATGESAATFDTGIYSTTTAGELSAVQHSWNNAGTEKAYTVYNTTDDCIDFIFV